MSELQKNRLIIVNDYLNKLKLGEYSSLFNLFDKHAVLIDCNDNRYENLIQIQKYYHDKPQNKISHFGDIKTFSNGDIKAVVIYRFVHALNIPIILTFKFKDQSVLIEKVIIDYKH